MHSYCNLGPLQLPSYGLCIAAGIILANLIAFWIFKKYQMSWDNFILLEAYALAASGIGAKGLYLFVSRHDIEWDRFFEPTYFQRIMRGGFVFYGGVIGALFGLLLCRLIHKVSIVPYLRRVIFLVPFAHSFGRIGCFMAGCCFGVPYNGPGSVIFPEGCMAPAGIPLFPVQLVESACLMAISLILLVLLLKKDWPYMVETYFLMYALLRFALEYLRYDEVRGRFLFFTTSQWISIALCIFAIAGICYKLCRKKSSSKGHPAV